MTDTKDIVIAAQRKPKKKKIKRKHNPHCGLLSSGSTLINLACTNDHRGAFPKGKYVFIVGDSTSGKTFLSMSCFAEALRNPEFENYHLIYDNVEDGMLMDLKKLFNKKVAERVSPPAVDDEGIPIHSFTIEEFYYNVDDWIDVAKDSGRPFIYILDSMDGLSSSSEGDKFEQHKEAHRRGKTSPGSYGDGKAKKNSEGLRTVLRGLRDTGSILIILSQTRDNIGFGFEKKTRSGGHALRFYATLEIWTSLKGKIKKTVRGIPRNIGIKAGVRIKKNRLTGQEHETMITIYPSYGIDDIGDCIDFLVMEKWWAKKGQKIIATEFDHIGCTRDKLISLIEENDWYQKLQTITGKCWQEIQEASCLVRKKKYQEDAE